MHELIYALQVLTLWVIMQPKQPRGDHRKDARGEVQDQNLRPFAAALVSMAGLGPSHAQYILQLPPESTISEEQQKDALRAAIKLYNTPENKNRVVEVNAMESLREARTQCAVCPGVSALPLGFSPLSSGQHITPCLSQ